MTEVNETFQCLTRIAGGPALLDWLAVSPHHDRATPSFGDAEIIALHLNRNEQSKLVIQIDRASKTATVTFILGDWIDVRLFGFNSQNVIGGLAIRRAGERSIEPWEVGVGCIPGEFEINLEPCFGANGTIRATILQIIVQKS